MQVIDNSSVAYKHFFLQGYRAQPTGAGPAGTDVEKVGVLVIKQGMNSAGDVLNDKDVLLTDELYDPTDPELIRLESDIAITKPALDVVVVNANTDAPEFIPPPFNPVFGDVRIHRITGVNQTLALLNYGWRLRAVSPRVDEAGDAGSFTPDVDQPEKLPANFDNTFFNGGRVNTLSGASTGDRFEFDESGSAFLFELTIPATPQLSFSLDDTLIDPQPAVELGVDTVVLDRTSVEALFVWRAIFPWDDAFETAVLEIN